MKTGKNNERIPAMLMNVCSNKPWTRVDVSTGEILITAWKPEHTANTNNSMQILLTSRFSITNR